jgi:hypothetical protein
MSKNNKSNGNFRLVIMGREIIALNWGWSVSAGVVAVIAPVAYELMKSIS